MAIYYIDVDDEIASAAARIRDARRHAHRPGDVGRLAPGDVADQFPAARPRGAPSGPAPGDHRRRRDGAIPGSDGRSAGLRQRCRVPEGGSRAAARQSARWCRRRRRRARRAGGYGRGRRGGPDRQACRRWARSDDRRWAARGAHGPPVQYRGRRWVALGLVAVSPRRRPRRISAAAERHPSS